ncbi:heat shock protein 90 [Emiliania huxleyi CCMP1516]|uniref:Histidine kinase/HSP90-like ATPase domain-containing protein n=2 Tax=Emiliania huxleyi TaxID=2903 RepID=A0A0D3IDS7_EMIH1|nr:heat shock protein 90 [Emiliania huxleyi CCMP1516]EOD09412.1 heat shock protein 90 [Emiliania huxleyi CCMP1516]|eukprot:XP_005761841.1 heat shock protein 90 [Emiliania huxleyi CCMP1516]
MLLRNLGRCSHIVRARLPLRRSCSGVLRRLSTTSEAKDAATESTEGTPPPPPAEAILGATETKEFQAETKKLLDIVANSLYTDKEVFLREIVSNASDALEKRRYAEVTGSAEEGAGEMAISITTDSEAGTLTITDSGIGMSRDDLVANLGTIASSGSKRFVQQLADTAGDGASAASANVIGQFGVGFYSVFMVADHVTVYSRQHGAEAGHCWRSSGDGAYELSEASNVAAGTKIVLTLKEEEKRFASRWAVEANLRKYSSFVGFPVSVDGERANTIEALWTKAKSEVSDEEHAEFFRFIAQDFSDPRYTLHFAADAPLAIKALFYIPESHPEKWGMARMEPGVSLYSRRVLIQPRSDKLLPDWMRFVKGVVDSEDVPLNISRESMQDSALMRKLSSVLSRRVLKFLQERGDERAKKDEEGYLAFFREFGQFIKEGVCADFELKSEAAKLLRFESTAAEPDTLVSLDEYIARMVPEQEDTIYYLVEVLLLTSTIDEFAMANLMSYAGKELVSAEKAKLQVEPDAETPAISAEDAGALCTWLAEAVPLVSEASLSSRLVDSPAIVVGHESAAMRRMMGMVEAGRAPELSPQRLEINGRHPIILGLAAARSERPELAKQIAQQVFDNALISAGLLDDPRAIVGNINSIMAELLSRPTTQPESSS